MDYYIQGDAARAKEIKAAFEAKGCVMHIGIQCDLNDMIYFSYNGKVGCMKLRNLDLFKTHPDYKELELPIESKFKVGDWVVSTREPSLTYRILESNVTNELGELDYKVEIYSNGIYEKTCFIASNKMDEWGRLWTIQDAKDGDVLVTEDYIFIFKYILHGGVHLYCHYNIDDEEFDSDIPDAIIGNIHDKGAHFRPATKEQRDLLFAKMKEAGYEWDAEKKELRKIKPHYNISNFHAGMPVLVRDYNKTQWRYVQFSHYVGGESSRFNACGNCWCQCIPYEGNEHLLGTTDMCDGQYINW